MISKLIDEQLKKVEYADLSNFNSDTNTFLIKKRVDIKIEEDHEYLIKLKPSAFSNQTIIYNWNAGSMIKEEYLKVDVVKCMGKMIKVNAVAFDYNTRQNLNIVWSGWLSVDDLEIISKL